MAQPHGASINAINQLRRKSGDLALRSDDPLDRSLAVAIDAIGAVFQPAYDGHAERAMQKLSWERGIAAHSEMAGGVSTRSISFGLVESLYFVLDRVIAMGQERAEQEVAREPEVCKVQISAQPRPSIGLPPSGERTSSMGNDSQPSAQPRSPMVILPLTGQRTADSNQASAQPRSPMVTLPLTGQRTSSTADKNEISVVTLSDDEEETRAGNETVVIELSDDEEIPMLPRRRATGGVDERREISTFADDIVDVVAGEIDGVQAPRTTTDDIEGHGEISDHIVDVVGGEIEGVQAPRTTTDDIGGRDEMSTSFDEDVKKKLVPQAAAALKADSIGGGEISPLKEVKCDEQILNAHTANLLEEAKFLWVIPPRDDDVVVVDPAEPNQVPKSSPVASPRDDDDDAVVVDPPTESGGNQAPSRTLADSLEALSRGPERSTTVVKQEMVEWEDEKIPLDALQAVLFGAGWREGEEEAPPVLQPEVDNWQRTPGANDASMQFDWYSNAPMTGGGAESPAVKPTRRRKAARPRKCKVEVASRDGSQERAKACSSREAVPTYEPVKKRKRRSRAGRGGLGPVKQELQPDGTADVAGMGTWLAELSAMGGWNAAAAADGAVGGPMIGGGVKREPKVKKNATDLACPECELVTRSLSTFLLHIKRVHGTSPTVFSHILRCDCGQECASTSHAEKCPIAHFTLMRREDSKYASVEDPRVYPQCVLCEAHPTTMLGHVAHLLNQHSTTLRENGIYLSCACGVQVYSRHSNAKWSHTAKCGGLFTVQALVGDEEEELPVLEPALSDYTVAKYDLDEVPPTYDATPSDDVKPTHEALATHDAPLTEEATPFSV